MHHEADGRNKNRQRPDIESRLIQEHLIGSQEESQGTGEKKSRCHEDQGTCRKGHDSCPEDVFGLLRVCVFAQRPPQIAEGPYADNHGAAGDDLHVGAGNIDACHGIDTCKAAEKDAVYHALCS